MLKDKEVKQGDILLAEPFMADSYFIKAAILVTDYHPTGTVGFILNKPINMKVNDLLLNFPEFDGDVFFGGPVGTDTIHFLHNLGDLLEGSRLVANGVYWGGNFDKLKFLIKSGLVQPNQIRFYVGYSGWSPGQLEEEINNSSWVISHNDPNYVFKSPSDQLWKQVLMNKGEIYAILSELPENTNYN
ncbi:MAG: YqgE/AlgH family protein [Saprospiraceae bacterium]|nr:YqgE/AlgH family protein [Saprospiraceae bacterium]